MNFIRIFNLLDLTISIWQMKFIILWDKIYHLGSPFTDLREMRLYSWAVHRDPFVIFLRPAIEYPLLIFLHHCSLRSIDSKNNESK